uniref:Uncharacterized protein n=1 Tax=Scleropages formosus TaxID=113540 RepID=A0A8C9VJT2_SCLFO
MPLDLAVQNIHQSTVKHIVEEEIRHHKNRRTFLHVAAIKNNYNLVMVLLKSGSPVDAKDNQRKTSLFHAVNLRNENTARVLLEAGAKVDSDIMEAALNLNDKSMFSLILNYAKELPPDAMKSLLFKAVRNDLQYTPLLLAAELGNVYAFNILMSKNASVEDKLPNGNSSLHLAVQSGNMHITKLLLEEGVDANAVGSQEQTPLHLTALYNQSALVEELLHVGAHINVVSVQVCSFKCSKCFYCIPFKVDSKFISQHLFISEILLFLLTQKRMYFFGRDLNVQIYLFVLVHLVLKCISIKI